MSFDSLYLFSSAADHLLPAAGSCRYYLPLLIIIYIDFSDHLLLSADHLLQLLPFADHLLLFAAIFLLPLLQGPRGYLLLSAAGCRLLLSDQE